MEGYRRWGWDGKRPKTILFPFFFLNLFLIRGKTSFYQSFPSISGGLYIAVLSVIFGKFGLHLLVCIHHPVETSYTVIMYNVLTMLMQFEMFHNWVDTLFIYKDLFLYFPVHKDEISKHSWFSNTGPWPWRQKRTTASKNVTFLRKESFDAL